MLCLCIEGLLQFSAPDHLIDLVVRCPGRLLVAGKSKYLHLNKADGASH